MAFGSHRKLERQRNGWWLVRLSYANSQKRYAKAKPRLRLGNAVDCVIAAHRRLHEGRPTVAETRRWHSGPIARVLPLARHRKFAAV